MTVKFFSTDCEETTGTGSNVDLRQITKLNVQATEENPHITTIERKFDSKFNKIPIEVLRVEGNEKEVLEVLANFDNSDKTDFIDNYFIEFDGVMSLKTDYKLKTKLINKEQNIYDFNLSELDKFGDRIESIDYLEVI